MHPTAEQARDEYLAMRKAEKAKYQSAWMRSKRIILAELGHLTLPFSLRLSTWFMKRYIANCEPWMRFVLLMELELSPKSPWRRKSVA